jgi:hypothetical protein
MIILSAIKDINSISALFNGQLELSLFFGTGTERGPLLPVGMKNAFY